MRQKLLESFGSQYSNVPYLASWEALFSEGRLEKIMRVLKVTQLELSHYAGVSLPTLRTYIKGTHTPTPARVRRITSVMSYRSLLHIGGTDDDISHE